MNKNLKLLFFSFLSIFCSVVCVYAQRKPKAEAFGFYFEGKNQKSSKIKFDLYSNLIVVKVKIDNSDTLNFILDTGVSSFIITDTTIAKKLKLNYSRQVKINGAGEKSFVNANVSVNHTVDLGYIRAQKQNLVVLENDILNLSSYMGIPVHGIFGHELFSRYVLVIDFRKREITVTEPKKFKFKKALGDQFPIIVTQSKPFLNASELAQTDGVYKPLRLVIDTGAGHALMLNTQDNSNIVLPEKVIRANLGRGLNGNIDGSIGRIDKFKIGKYEFNNILASFPDSLSFSVKFDSHDIQRQGSIGGEFLRRFIVTFNYSEGYLALKPLKRKNNESFEHDMSGLEIRAMGNKLNEFVVASITPDSQSDKAGLLIGDQIIFLNNIHSKELNINQIYQFLSKKEGSKIELFVRRDNELKFFNFRLKRVI